MFTGIVTARAQLRQRRPVGSGAQLEFAVHPGPAGETWHDLAVGESIAVSGACLTLVAIGREGHLAFDVVAETLQRTTLGELRPGQWANLERALRVGDRLGGHYVTGHVDRVGVVRHLERRPGATTLHVRVPDATGVPFRTVEKGSVTVDGVSLTVVDSAPAGFSVALIPHTLEVTSLGELRAGSHVNLEMDHFGRWVEALHGGRPPAEFPHDGK